MIYELGQYVFVRRIPRRFYKDQQENVKYHINLKLQPIRWTGPYRIIQKKRRGRRDNDGTAS